MTIKKPLHFDPLQAWVRGRQGPVNEHRDEVTQRLRMHDSAYILLLYCPSSSSNMAVPAAIGVAGIAVLYAGKRYFQGPRCKSNKSLKGKTVVITGGNTGIGKETAVDLARRGARVIIGCRNLQKGKEALNEIKERSGNPNVFLEEIDLASLESVRKFADTILNSEPRLDILINNA